MNQQKYNLYANDKFAYFNDFVLIRDNKRGKIGKMEMTKWKKDVLQSNYILIKKIRCCGVSELLAAEIAYNLNFKKKCKMAYMTGNMAMAIEMHRKILIHFNNIPDNIRVRFTCNNKNELETDTGSQIILFGESTGAFIGYAIDVLYMEEVDFFKNFYDIYISTVPCVHLSKQGKIVLTTTPGYNTSYFHDLWKDTHNLFSRVEITYGQSTLPKIVYKHSLNDISKTKYFNTIRDCII